jgi:hypothetical protein
VEAERGRLVDGTGRGQQRGTSSVAASEVSGAGPHRWWWWRRLICGGRRRWRRTSKRRCGRDLRAMLWVGPPGGGVDVRAAMEDLWAASEGPPGGDAAMWAAAVAVVSRIRRMKTGIGSRLGTRKESIPPISITHIHRLANEYRRAVQTGVPYICRFGHVMNKYRQRIFVGDVAELTNIWGSQSQIGWPIYLLVPSPNR